MHPVDVSLIGDSNPCRHIVVYEFLNVFDIVNLASTHLEFGLVLLKGYIKWVSLGAEVTLPSDPDVDEMDRTKLMRSMILWLRTMPLKALDGCRREGNEQRRILASYSHRFKPWFMKFDPCVRANLFYMYRIRLSRRVYAGLGLHPWIYNPRSNKTHVVRAPAHMIPDPHNSELVFWTFPFTHPFQSPLNTHLDSRTVDELLEGVRDVVGATPELTQCLRGEFGIRALLGPNASATTSSSRNRIGFHLIRSHEYFIWHLLSNRMSVVHIGKTVITFLFCLAGLGSVLVMSSIVVGGAQSGTALWSSALMALVGFMGIFMGGPAVALRMCSLIASFVCLLVLISSNYEHQTELIALSHNIHAHAAPLHHLVDRIATGRLNLALHDIARGPGDSILAVAALKHVAQSFRSFVAQLQTLQHFFLPNSLNSPPQLLLNNK